MNRDGHNLGASRFFCSGRSTSITVLKATGAYTTPQLLCKANRESPPFPILLSLRALAFLGSQPTEQEVGKVGLGGRIHLGGRVA